jgi:hypothetical protein
VRSARVLAGGPHRASPGLFAIATNSATSLLGAQGLTDLRLAARIRAGMRGSQIGAAKLLEHPFEGPTTEFRTLNQERAAPLVRGRIASVRPSSSGMKRSCCLVPRISALAARSPSACNLQFAAPPFL